MSTTLRLTPFERCLVLEHCAGYPCDCFVRTVFEGRVDDECFTNAVRSALEFHPLLRAVVKTQWTEKWTFPDSSEPSIKWREGHAGGPFPHARQIDIYRETGLKILVIRDQSNTDVLFQFHHACCDGAGIDRFIDDVLVNYTREREHAWDASHSPCQHPATVDVHRLTKRGAHGLRFSSTLKVLPSQLVGLLGAAQFWGRQPKPVVEHQARNRDTASQKQVPSITSYRFDKAETLTLRKAAIERNVSLHELLVRDFFLALWKWQKKLGQYNADSWVRMMVPMNMRDTSYRSLPAMNQVSSIFLDRRGKDGSDPDQLLNSIREEMEVIRKFQLRYTFLFLLGILNRIPTALKKSVTRDECKTSVIFSSLGKSLRRCGLPRESGRIRAGDIVLNDIYGIAPLRPYNCFTIFNLEYANRLRVNLHYDAEFVSPADAEELMNLFVLALNETIQVSGR